MVFDIFIAGSRAMRSTKDLGSLYEWLDYYHSEGRRYLQRIERYNLTSEPTLRLKMLRKYLCHAVDWAVSRRARHLRKSPAYFSLVGGTAAAGFLPFGKTGANAVASSMFLSKTLAAFGLEDQEALLELTWDTAV